MTTAIETAIIERLYRLDEQRQTEVLHFVEFLASQSRVAIPQNSSQAFDPMRYSGTVSWPVDGLAFQDATRKEWE